MKKEKNAQNQKPAMMNLDKKSLIIKHPFITLFIVTFILLLIFYHQLIFMDKTFQAPDQLTSRAATPFVKDALSRGITPLWCPYIFSGMPSFGSLLSAPHINLIDETLNLILQIFSVPAFMFIFLNYMIFAVFMFYLARSFKIETIPALFCSIAIIFIPQFIAFTAFGHNTKFLSVVLIPIILMLTVKLLHHKNMLYFSLTALAIGFQMIRAHIQVSYYTFLLIAIYFLFKEISEYREKKDLKASFISATLLIGAVVAGVMLSMVLYTSVLDYQRFSIRGGTSEGGLDFEYASNWSFHPIEMVTFFVPSFMGFGGDTYWGKMPFTDYPLYFSVIVFLLSGIAFVLRRDRVTWFIGVVVLFSLVVSFGKHLPLLYTPMFKILPFFNKFRVPSMIHILLDFGMVLLAGYGFQALLDFRDKNMRVQDKEALTKKLRHYLYIFFAIVAIIAVFLLFAKTFYLNLAGSGNIPLNGNQRELAYDKAVLDGFKSVLLIVLSMVFILQYLRKGISQFWLGCVFIALLVFDLWMVDFKIINPRPDTDEKAFFATSPVVNYLKQDKDLYRIFPVLDDKGGNWYMRHFIQNISGYSAAKLRIYQELLDETGFGSQDRYGLNSFISKYWRISMRDNRVAPIEVPFEQISAQRLAFDSAVLDMLNVKYLIVNYLPLNDPRYKPVADPQQLPIYENTSVLPRVFFVDSTVVIRGRKPIFDYMKSGQFDPHHIAIVEENQPFKIAGSINNRMSVSSYDIHEIKIDAFIEKPALMVLSEIYYPSGWHAFVDGKETKIYKTNYLLRSIFLQPGQHKVIFHFSPFSYKLGVWISSLILFVLLGLMGFSSWNILRQKYRQKQMSV